MDAAVHVGQQGELIVIGLFTTLSLQHAGVCCSRQAFIAQVNMRYWHCMSLHVVAMLAGACYLACASASNRYPANLEGLTSRCCAWYACAPSGLARTQYSLASLTMHCHSLLQTCVHKLSAAGLRFCNKLLSMPPNPQVASSKSCVYRQEASGYQGELSQQEHGWLSTGGWSAACLS